MVFLSLNVCNPTFKSDLKNPAKLIIHDPNPKLKLKKNPGDLNFSTKNVQA
jgi:hypothetical protein